MQRDDKRGEFILPHVLYLVNEESHGRLAGACGVSDKLHQVLQVGLKVPVVRQAGFRLKVEAHLDVLVLHLERAYEPGEAAESALCEATRGLALRQSEQGHSQLRRENRRQ